jgi:hypothetical protein
MSFKNYTPARRVVPGDHRAHRFGGARVRHLFASALSVGRAGGHNDRAGKALDYGYGCAERWCTVVADRTEAFGRARCAEDFPTSRSPRT